MTFKRRVLSVFGKDQLLEIGRGLGLDINTRMTVAELRDALAGSKKAKLALLVTDALARDTLKEICRACGLDDTGKEKQPLVERILAAGGSGQPSNLDEDTADSGSAGDGSVGLGTLPGSDVAKETKGKRKTSKGAERRRAGVPESDAVVSGSLKAALRQFALAAAGGYRGHGAAVNFATHLLECFGWKDGRPEGATIPHALRIAEGGQLVDREVALWWRERRTMLAVVPHDAVLDFAWKDLLHACLQIDPPPQYVVLTNQRDLQLYDLARDREAARLSIHIEDLPKYSEAFPFFTTAWQPGQTPRIVNVEKVSAEVADLVAKLYRSVRAQHPTRERDVIRFTLQCITAMFAEDIGLLPKNYFTSLLYDGARHKNLDARLHELFVQMNTRDLPTPRVVPYFNGGLFTDAVSLPLGSEQVVALTKAAEANWTYVDPHIFGSVFQGIMDDAERHASGAHYTAHDDIMRVVGPTIVEPWRKRILAATTLKELTELRAELFRYRVLDPACGSGNFLYVAFRELYRLDTELLSRMREFPSTHGKLSWNGGIPAANFYGIDINPFAVELAKVTLNIAKKIAFEERREQAYVLAGQVQLDLDPSLPLDNLDENIVCQDALFSDWPQVDAIVGNPPFLGGQKIRKELGVEYLERLQRDSGVNGVVDMACYWFRRAHERLGNAGRAGLVGTSGIRVGRAREAALDYIVANGGTITNAVSSRIWPGEAAVNVSMVNWTKSAAGGPFVLLVDDVAYEVPRVASHLQLHADVSVAESIEANAEGASLGVIFGHDAFRSTAPGFSAAIARQHGDHASLRPMAGGDDMLRGRLATQPDWCIYIEANNESDAREKGGPAFDYLSRTVRPWLKERASSLADTGDYATWLKKWWRPQKSREDFLSKVSLLTRVVVSAKISARSILSFISTRFVPNDTMMVFALEDDYSFGVMQSRYHWQWTRAKGSKVTDRIQYTTAVWRTFPWPQSPTVTQLETVALAGRVLRSTRDQLTAENGWSLRQLYQAAEVDGPHPLKDAQVALDAAVRDAYGAPPDQDPVEFLLELNQLVAEDEAAGRKVRGPGLPDHLDPKDPRWFSTDCIEPPPLAE